MGGTAVLELGGDPAAIQTSATRWLAFGLTAASASVGVTDQAAAAVGFRGDEGETFAGRLTADLADPLAVMGRAWDQVSGALTGFADELDTCQSELRVLARHTDPAGRPVVRARALAIRGRHDQALRQCCRLIDQATDMAPPVAASVRGFTAGGYHPGPVTTTRLALVSAGLRIAAGVTACLPPRLLTSPVPLPGNRDATVADATAADATAGDATAADDGADDTDSGDVRPVQGSAEELRERIYQPCLADELFKDPTDVHGATLSCIGIANSAMEDPGSMQGVMANQPWVTGYPPDDRSPWEALWEGTTKLATTIAEATIDVFPDARDGLGKDLATDREVVRMQALSDVLEPMMLSPELDWEDYAAWLNRPEWTTFTERSRAALSMLVLNGGWGTAASDSSTGDLVTRPADRALVTRAVASLAEASYRRHDHPHDAGDATEPPTYLVRPDQAVATLTSVGRLDKPRTHIGTIYRDTYQEIPRLEILHDAITDHLATESLAEVAADALCSLVRSNAGWDLNPEELAQTRP